MMPECSGRSHDPPFLFLREPLPSLCSGWEMDNRMTERSKSLGVDREGVRPNSGLTSQQQEPKPAHPTHEQAVREFAAWLAKEYDELQREHFGEAADEYIASVSEGAK